MREMQNLVTIIICPYAQFCFGRKHILAKMAELANLHSFTSFFIANIQMYLIAEKDFSFLETENK